MGCGVCITLYNPFSGGCSMCTVHWMTGPGGCRARSGGFGRSFWTLLASCYADPTVGRGQGTLHLDSGIGAVWEIFSSWHGMSGSFKSFLWGSINGWTGMNRWYWMLITLDICSHFSCWSGSLRLDVSWSNFGKLLVCNSSTDVHCMSVSLQKPLENDA